MLVYHEYTLRASPCDESSLQDQVTKGSFDLLPTGMTNQEALSNLERGYRMARPAMCPDTMYDVMLKCWAAMPDERPTFEFLHNFFEDFFVSAESQYEEN